MELEELGETLELLDEDGLDELLPELLLELELLLSSQQRQPMVR